MSKWRKTTWGIVAWSAVLAIWAVGGATAVSGATVVTDLVGPVVGFGFILMLWLAGSTALCIISLITRQDSRSPC